MITKLLSICLLLISSLCTIAQHNIIPIPVQYAAGTGVFVLNGQQSIEVAPAQAELLKPMMAWFKTRLAQSGIAIKGKHIDGRKITIALGSNTAIAQKGDEAYALSVMPNTINIEANTPKGVFYAMQTFFQLLPPNFEAKSSAPASYSIPECTIVDYPRFGWRGLMLDVSRHFFTVAEVKSYVDIMAAYKFNVLHWHLTDDQGWRIEIKSLPKLTEIGACRVTRYGTFGERIAPKPGEKADDCGFYTQEDIKEVVAYAQTKQITIVPEIDVPGHSMAAIAAYPELSVTQQPQQVSPGHKFSEWYGGGKFKMLQDNTLNPADEKVYTFLDKVFTEVAQLFPGEYIHMGGDECYHGYWEADAKVQAFMKKQGIKDVHALQSYFVKRVADIIASKGKSTIGWDEILEGGLDAEATVMSWRGMEGGIEAAKLGKPVVMTPTTFAYIDYMQADEKLDPRIYASLYLKKCYEFEPLPAGIDAKLILGGQANLWTEKVPTMRHAQYMTYPRALAISEVLWSPAASKNWNNFVQRTESQFARFDAAGVMASRAIYDASIKVKNIGNKENPKLEVTLNCEHPDAAIHYTIDGSFPSAYTSLYTQPLVIPDGPVNLMFNTVLPNGKMGRLLNFSKEELLKRAK